MLYAELFKLGFYRRFYLGALAACYYMHCGINPLAVKAPKVDVMHAEHPFNLTYLKLYLFYRKVFGRFYDQKVENLF